MSEMSFTEHLEDLRWTTIRVAIILIIAFGIAYFFSTEISEFLLHPLRENLKSQGMGGGEVVYYSILDKMMSQIQISFWTAILVASPIWFYEIWKFIRPGLHAYEIKVIRPFLMIGLFLFWAGAAFGHFVAFPLTFKALMGVGVSDVKAMIGLKEYLLFVSQVIVVMGLIFQLPNLLLILGFMGIVTKYSLKKLRRYIYFGLAVFAAVVSPPDVITMLILWIPLILLFEVGLLAVALIVHPYLAKVHAS